MTDTGKLLPHGDAFPEVAPSAWIAPGAHVIGAVLLGEESSVWYGAVLRGDTEPIRIGARTNVQDGCILHADPGYPAIVGDDCVIGHNAIVHGCQIERGCLVGMGATILNGAKIGEGSIVAAGAPAKPVRELTEERTQSIAHGVREYVERAASHRESLERSS